MKNYLNPNMTDRLCEMSAQGLAHVGDAVFELMVRTYLVSEGIWDASKLHDKAVSYVSAGAQATAVKRILPLLSEDEEAVFKRGRNAHTRPAPKNSVGAEYHAATGLETLFGYLYLSDNISRLNELFESVIGEK